MGEGIGNDELIMPYITSANIACSYHAGDEETMKQTILLAQKYNVNIGAHPSYFDRENFGRKVLIKSPDEVYDLVTKQVLALKNIAGKCNAVLNHVKPHGALYNQSAKDKSLAKAIAEAVKNVDEKLVLFGLSGSFLISESKALGLKTASEVFADRTYQDDGTLTPRTQSNALIKDTEEVIEQVLKMIKERKVKTVSGKEIDIIAETICIHGDGENAVKLAKAINDNLKSENIIIGLSEF
jgi:UPF0271 protein